VLKHRKGGKRIGDQRLNPCEQKPTRVLAGGSVRGVLTHARPNETPESVAGYSITHWRQYQTRGSRFLVAFACVVQALPVDGASTGSCRRGYCGVDTATRSLSAASPVRTAASLHFVYAQPTKIASCPLTI
jgi:hypothetical protein